MKDGFWEIRPLGNNVLLGPLEQIAVSRGGIHYPQGHKDDATRYAVVAVGPKVRDVRPGDVVIAPLYFTHLVLEDGTDRRVADANQLIAVMRDEEQTTSKTESRETQIETRVEVVVPRPATQ